MPDILIRICVGACGLFLVFMAGAVSAEHREPSYVAGVMVLFMVGLITILRALGVL